LCKQFTCMMGLAPGIAFSTFLQKSTKSNEKVRKVNMTFS
jgi:hypothetical protein